MRNTTGLKRTAGPGRPKGAKNKLTIARVEEEIRRLALMDPLALFERAQGSRRVFTLREIADMDPDTRACIASVKVKTENLTAGDKKQDTTVEIRLWNKIDALTLCAKHFGWVKDHVVVEGLDDRKARLAAGRARLQPDAE